jgi:hypothetical protein
MTNVITLGSILLEKRLNVVNTNPNPRAWVALVILG